MLANHLDRPEIAKVVFSGTGMGIRKSDTLSESVFYYTKKLDNGQILRVGKEAHSVVAVLLAALPMVLTTALLLAAVCLMVSHYFTSAIVKPIDEMAGDIYRQCKPRTKNALCGDIRLRRADGSGACR